MHEGILLPHPALMEAQGTRCEHLVLHVCKWCYETVISSLLDLYNMFSSRAQPVDLVTHVCKPAQMIQFCTHDAGQAVAATLMWLHCTP